MRCGLPAATVLSAARRLPLSEKDESFGSAAAGCFPCQVIAGCRLFDDDNFMTETDWA